MKINYQISQKAPGKPRHNHRRGVVDVIGSWEDVDFHRAIRQEIANRHPGWAIVGYAEKLEGSTPPTAQDTVRTA